MKKPVEEKNMIPGPVGQLETLLSYVNDNGSHIAVICHPHPLHGGTMMNKVVHYTARSLNEMGVPALRFNFRGVGASEGGFGNARGEADDLTACVKWMEERYPDRQLLLAGFSFGSYVAAKMAAYLKAAGLISIAPAVNFYDFGQLEKPDCPWLVIQGDEDEVVPAEQVKQWAESTPEVSYFAWMAGASHFFHGNLLMLSDTIKEWLKNTLDLG